MHITRGGGRRVRPRQAACARCGDADAAKPSVARPGYMRATGERAAGLLKVLTVDFGVKDARTYFSGNERCRIHAHDGVCTHMHWTAPAKRTTRTEIQGRPQASPYTT